MLSSTKSVTEKRRDRHGAQPRSSTSRTGDAGASGAGVGGGCGRSDSSSNSSSTRGGADGSRAGGGGAQGKGRRGGHPKVCVVLCACHVSYGTAFDEERNQRGCCCGIGYEALRVFYPCRAVSIRSDWNLSLPSACVAPKRISARVE